MTAPRSSVQAGRQVPLKNKSLDQFERCIKSFAMHHATLCPHNFLCLPAGRLCSEMVLNKFDIVGLGDLRPGKCEGNVGMHVCDGLEEQAFGRLPP